MIFTMRLMVSGKRQRVNPDDKPCTGGFSDLADEIEDLMLETTNSSGWQERMFLTMPFYKTL